MLDNAKDIRFCCIVRGILEARGCNQYSSRTASWLDKSY